MFVRLGHHYWSNACGENYFVFHALQGEPFIVSADIHARLAANAIDSEFAAELADAGYFADDRLYEANHAKSLGYIDRYDGPSVLDLTLSESCNLACHMCSHAQTTGKNPARVQHGKLMRFETARAWIDHYVDTLAPRNQLAKYSLHYGAAEPLINKRVFLQVLAYVREKTVDTGLPVEQLVNTNLTLLDDELIEAFATYGVKVSVGLDGLREQNNRIRVTRQGAGTFDLIVRNIERLTTAGISVGVALTLTARNLELVEPEAFLRAMQAIGVRTVLVDSDFIHRVPFTAERVTDTLLAFYRSGEELGIEILGSWRTPFASLTTEPGEEPNAFCTSLLGKNLTVTPAGALTFCTYSGTRLAEYDLAAIPQAVAQFTEGMRALMRQRLPTLTTQCQDCPLSGHCSGGCYLTYEVTGKQHAMCDIYLTATERLIDYKYGEEVIEA